MDCAYANLAYSITAQRAIVGVMATERVRRDRLAATGTVVGLAAAERSTAWVGVADAAVIAAGIWGAGMHRAAARGGSIHWEHAGNGVFGVRR